MTEIDDRIQEKLEALNLSGDTGKVLGEVNRLKQRATDVGIDEALLEPRDSLFGTILNTIDKPKQVVQGVLDATFLRGDIGEIGLLGAAERGLDERINAFDILRRETDLNPIARGVLGFGAELLTDPLNFITLGAGTAAKAGGRALTKTGVAVKDDIVRNLTTSVDDLTDAHKVADDWFRAFGDVEDARKTLATSSDPVLLGKAQQTLDTQAKFVSDGLEEYGLSSDLFESTEALFEKPKIKLSTSLPFLGHFTDDFDSGIASVKRIKEDDSTFKSLIRGAYEGAGKVLKPGKIDIADIDISDDFIDSYNKAKSWAGEAAENVEAYFDEVLKAGQEIPGLRTASKLTASGKEAAKEFKKLLGKAFSRRAVFGKQGAITTDDFINDKAIAPLKSTNDTMELFDGVGGRTIDEIIGASEEVVEKRKLAGQLVDRVMESTIDDVVKEFSPAERDEFIGYLSQIRKDPKATFKNMPRFENLDTTITGRLRDTLKDETIDPEVREFMSRAVEGFERLAKEETELGIRSNLIESYIPHRYTNLEKGANTTTKQAFGYGPPKADFQLQRKYSTVDEAFKESGYLANTDIVKLFQDRAQASYVAKAKKRYMNRMLVQQGIPADVMRNLFKEAKADPNGPAAKALARHNLTLPRVLGDEDAITQLKNFARVGDKEAISSNPVLNELVEKSGVGMDELLQNYNSVVAKIEDDLLLKKGGFKDADIPRLTFGELATPLKAENGELYYLPTDIAKGIDEVVAQKDIVREFLGGSKAGEMVLNSMDGITNAFKKVTTLPWPAYWSQNLFGDAFFRAADGGLHAIEPGTMGKTLGLLRGTHSITLKNGTTLDPATFKKVLVDGGIYHGYDEAIDVLRSASDLDIDKHIKRTKGVLKNLKLGKKGEFNPLIAAEAASQNMRNTFENFFRANHVLHHIERGDSFTDAVRGANDAMINYRNLTEIERSVFRRFYMFYGWIGGSTKRTITNLFTQPGALQQQLKGAQATAEFFSSPDAAPSPDEFDMKTLRSLVSEEQVAFALGKDKDGKPIIGRGFGLPLNTALQQFSVQLPRNMQISEIMDSFSDSIERTAQKQFASANPVIKAAAERITGRNLYFDQPLNTRFLRRLPQLQEAAKKLGVYEYTKVPVDAVDDVTKNFLDGVPDGQGNLVVDPGKMWVLVNVIPGLGRAISTARTISDPDLPLSAGLLKTFTGVRVEDSDPTRSRLYDEKRDLQDLLRSKDVDLREDKKKRELLGL